jgi:uncharacterized protein YjlB
MPFKNVCRFLQRSPHKVSAQSSLTNAVAGTGSCRRGGAKGAEAEIFAGDVSIMPAFSEKLRKKEAQNVVY